MLDEKELISESSEPGELTNRSTDQPINSTLTDERLHIIPKFLILVVVLALAYLSPIILHKTTPVLADEPSTDEVLTAPQPIHTTSRFETKLVTQVDTISLKTVTKDDPDKELDDDTVVQEGKDGQKTSIWKVYYYEGKEYSKELVSTDIVPAVNKIIDHGTKIVWRTIQTADGSITYWRKLRVWATQYDSHCPGCNNWTATGLPQGKGVIAVDPSVIKLGSKLYVPGYGEAVAGDTGGSIKGNIVDLGFPDAHTSGWVSHFVDIYLQ